MKPHRNGKISASDVAEAISNCHTKDVVVTECKDGPTWSTDHCRVDVWTMKRSWSRPMISGYEIKITRQDFLNDTKWHNYLPLCNQFYFACPKNLLTADEMPAEAGLVYCVGSTIRQVKKAAWRDIQIPESLCRYLLMCRTRIVPPNHYEEPNKSSKLDYWRDWVNQKEERKELGYAVAHQVKDFVNKVKSENIRLRAENERFSEVRSLMEKLNIPIHGYSWGLEDRIKAAKQVFPQEFCDRISDLSNMLEKVREDMDKYKRD